MKYKIGYLDENDQQRINFYSAFEDDFDVKVIDDFDRIQTVADLRCYVNELDLDALVVDFKLSTTGEIHYNGNEVFEEFSKNKKYFPVVILTSYGPDAIAQTDNVFVINDKEILKESHKKDLQDLKVKIAQAISNYKNKVRAIEEQIKILELKQRTESLANSEEEQLANLHLELKAIDPEANPLPANLLQTDIVRQLSELVKNTREILEGANRIWQI